MSRKYFGTDGIRGPVGGHPINAEFVLKLGWAAGRVLSPSGGGTILIGKDTRISGYILQSALEAGLASAGVNVLLLGPMPTPAVAYRQRQALLSALHTILMPITASSSFRQTVKKSLMRMRSESKMYWQNR